MVLLFVILTFVICQAYDYQPASFFYYLDSKQDTFAYWVWYTDHWLEYRSNHTKTFTVVGPSIVQNNAGMIVEGGGQQYFIPNISHSSTMNMQYLSSSPAGWSNLGAMRNIYPRIFIFYGNGTVPGFWIWYGKGFVEYNNQTGEQTPYQLNGTVTMENAVRTVNLTGNLCSGRKGKLFIPYIFQKYGNLYTPMNVTHWRNIGPLFLFDPPKNTISIPRSNFSSK